MKILVIDDSALNREAAMAQLKDHDLTVVGTSYEKSQKEVLSGKYEAVLVDLLMPANLEAVGSRGYEFFGQEMPVGIFLALLAAKNGAQFVGLFTDTSHHHHPASACLDRFNESESYPSPFTVEGATVILTNNRMWVNIFEPQDLSTPINDRDRPNTVIAKNWGKLLECLLDPVGYRTKYR